jgi:tryptophan-rich sensory protein
MTGKDILKLIGCIALPVAVGSLSGIATIEPLKDWYVTLNKPSFNPPNQIFGPVWTTLYILMGISLYFVVQQPASKVKTQALVVFGVQLFLNFWWSIIFFTFKNLLFALVEIIVLWIFIVTMIYLFRKLKPIAGYLQIPYLLWVSFATLLTYSIWMLNH